MGRRPGAHARRWILGSGSGRRLCADRIGGGLADAADDAPGLTCVFADDFELGMPCRWSSAPGYEGPACDVCGDRVVEPAAGEECDDGNLDGGGGCSPSCLYEICGNGILDLLEQCDSGGTETADCDRDCSPPECGDGIFNPAAGEQCDDANPTDGDGCSATCRFKCSPAGGNGPTAR